MAYCIQMFLMEGIVDPKFNVAERRLKQTATEEFIQYINTEIDLGEKYKKKEVTPDLSPEKMKLSLENSEKLLGVKLIDKQVKNFLERMGYNYS